VRSDVPPNRNKFSSTSLLVRITHRNLLRSNDKLSLSFPFWFSYRRASSCTRALTFSYLGPLFLSPSSSAIHVTSLLLLLKSLFSHSWRPETNLLINFPYSFGFSILIVAVCRNVRLVNGPFWLDAECSTHLKGTQVEREIPPSLSGLTWPSSSSVGWPPPMDRQDVSPHHHGPNCNTCRRVSGRRTCAKISKKTSRKVWQSVVCCWRNATGGVVLHFHLGLSARKQITEGKTKRTGKKETKIGCWTMDVPGRLESENGREPKISLFFFISEF